MKNDTEDLYQTDSGSNYSPSSSEADSEESLHPDEEDSSTNKTTGSSKKRTSRTRLHNVKEWKVNKRKTLRAQGKEYIRHNNKVHRAKSLVKFDHSCR